MAKAVEGKEWGKDQLTPDELMDSLEEIRREYSGGSLADFRAGPLPSSKEHVAASRRRSHTGVSGGNHRFEGERYLRIEGIENKEIRRFALRKLVDEEGQTTVGGTVPAHPTLQKWNSLEMGVTEEEIHDLERQDAIPSSMVSTGWYHWMHRTAPWQVVAASALVGEASKLIPEVKERMLRELDQTRELYQEWGIKDIDRAMAQQIEHSPGGVDDEHGLYDIKLTREYVNTPELQEELRKVYIYRLQRETRGQRGAL